MSAFDDLTEKQRKFVEAYMGEANGNATDAAALAGYAGDRNQIGTMGSKNLRKPKIIAAINEVIDDDPLVLSREQLLRVWSRIAYFDDSASASDKLRATENLAKAYGMFRQIHELEANIKHDFEVTVPGMGELDET